MEQYISNIIDDSSNDGYIIEYYPHIEILYENGGRIKNIDKSSLKIPYQQTKTVECTEYVHYEKILRIYENRSREYLHIQQKYNKLFNGLVIVEHMEFIDPNKFPIINKYHDVRRKNIITYEYKNIMIDVITEKPDWTYLKISFTIPSNEQMKKKIRSYFKEVVSSMT